MPTINQPVVIAFETQEEFDALKTKNDNAIYFITDTLRIYVGNSEYYSTMNTATKQYIDNAIGGITEMDYSVVNELPNVGIKGTIYFVPHQHGSNNTYDEYLWITDRFEKIGNTDIDLSGYIPVVTGANNKIPKFNSNGTLSNSGFELNKTVPSDAKFTDTTYSNATTSVAGLMSSADKSKVDSLDNVYLKKTDLVSLTEQEYENLQEKTAPYYFIIEE